MYAFIWRKVWAALGELRITEFGTIARSESNRLNPLQDRRDERGFLAQCLQIYIKIDHIVILNDASFDTQYYNKSNDERKVIEHKMANA